MSQFEIDFDPPAQNEAELQDKFDRIVAFAERNPFKAGQLNTAKDSFMQNVRQLRQQGVVPDNSEDKWIGQWVLHFI